MLRLPQLDVVVPHTVAEALDALAARGAVPVAGGTDLLPQLKQGRGEGARVLVSLHAVEPLRRIEVDADDRTMRIGAGVTLARLARDPRVLEAFPSLAQAAASVGTAQIRNAATIGGNVHLDTRCRYLNQSAFWRGAGGGCLKSGGDTCCVVAAGQRCVAAMSSDCVPPLVALDARIVLAHPGGERSLSLERYYRADGARHLAQGTGELCTALVLPLPSGPRRTEYVKWRPRGSIDFPLVSLALRFDLEGPGRDAPITSARVVAGALGARPRMIDLNRALVGRHLSEPALADEVAERVWNACRPLDNVPWDAAHRRRTMRVLTRRAVMGMGVP